VLKAPPVGSTEEPWQKMNFVHFKASGNHFEYSKYHVLQYNNQNLALANMAVSDCISLSPKGETGAG